VYASLSKSVGVGVRMGVISKARLLGAHLLTAA